MVSLVDTVKERFGSDSHTTCIKTRRWMISKAVTAGGTDEGTHTSVGLLADELVLERGPGCQSDGHRPDRVRRSRQRELEPPAVSHERRRARRATHSVVRVPVGELRDVTD